MTTRVPAAFGPAPVGAVHAPAAPAAFTEPVPSTGYQPRDPIFFSFAACVIASALQPSGIHDSDREQAERTASTCARMLDGGPAPDGFVAPRHARTLMTVAENERLSAGLVGQIPPGAGNWQSIGFVRNGNESTGDRSPPVFVPAVYPPIMTEGERADARKKLAKQGEIPKRGEVMLTNAEHLARIRDLSEPVRYTALHAAALRLANSPEITGARELEACGVIAEEIDRAIRVHAALGLPTYSMQTDEQAGREQGPAAVPYPASVGFLLTLNVMRAAEAAEADEQGDPDRAHDSRIAEDRPGA